MKKMTAKVEVTFVLTIALSIAAICITTAVITLFIFLKRLEKKCDQLVIRMPKGVNQSRKRVNTYVEGNTVEETSYYESPVLLSDNPEQEVDTSTVLENHEQSIPLQEFRSAENQTRLESPSKRADAGIKKQEFAIQKNYTETNNLSSESLVTRSVERGKTTPQHKVLFRQKSSQSDVYVEFNPGTEVDEVYENTQSAEEEIYGNQAMIDVTMGTNRDHDDENIYANQEMIDVAMVTNHDYGDENSYDNEDMIDVTMAASCADDGKMYGNQTVVLQHNASGYDVESDEPLYMNTDELRCNPAMAVAQ